MDRFIFIPLISLLFASCTSCSLPFDSPGGPQEIRIVSWNVQNLFDDVDDGTEYNEFVPGDQWNGELMNIRMERIAEVVGSVLESPPHILLLQEIENENTMNLLSSKYIKENYPWRIHFKIPDQAVGIALLSTYPIISVSSIETGYYGKLRLRPIMEARIDLEGEELVLFNNHWKSKSGGSGATEGARIQTATALKMRIKTLLGEEIPPLIIAGGDFNESHDEYKRMGRSYRTAFIPVIEKIPLGWEDSLFTTSKKERCGFEADKLVLYSPWYEKRRKGSYVYKTVWEKIDHFFLLPTLFDGVGLDYEAFNVIDDFVLLNDYNFPFRFESFSGLGYSDHLPVELILRSSL